jgi:hypothetical protein
MVVWSIAAWLSMIVQEVPWAPLKLIGQTFRSVVDFEVFRPELNAALSYADRTEDGRPPFDLVLMFKILVIQATNNLSDERADRLSFMRFLGLGLEDRVPDARTIWLFREKLTTAGVIKRLFEQFDAMLRQAIRWQFLITGEARHDSGCVALPKTIEHYAGHLRMPGPRRDELRSESYNQQS